VNNDRLLSDDAQWLARIYDRLAPADQRLLWIVARRIAEIEGLPPMSENGESVEPAGNAAGTPTKS
jgi:hypothetical protein